jgi:hypothetical protein
MSDDDNAFPCRDPFKRCPDCGGRDHIEVQATVWLRVANKAMDVVTKDEIYFPYWSKGVTQSPYHCHDLGSPAMCGHCGYRGALRDFHVDPHPTATGRA